MSVCRSSSGSPDDRGGCCFRLELEGNMTEVLLLVKDPVMHVLQQQQAEAGLSPSSRLPEALLPIAGNVLLKGFQVPPTQLVMHLLQPSFEDQMQALCEWRDLDVPEVQRLCGDVLCKARRPATRL